MKRELAVGALSLLQLGGAPPFPSLPTLPHVHVEVARDHLMVVDELNLPRGEWVSGDLDLYLAFGAPGTPLAVDVRLYALDAGLNEPLPQDMGEPVAVELASHRPRAALAFLGPAEMAGFVVHLRESAFRRALGKSGTGRLRVRTLLPLPSPDAAGGREVVVRLGSHDGPPITLGRVSLSVAGPSARSEARLCGKDADVYPLSISVEPDSGSPAPLRVVTADPSLAVRHPSDDLCVRFWAPF